MAEKVIIELDVEEGEAVAGLNKVESSVKDIGKATKKSSSGVKKFGKALGGLTKAAGFIGLIVIAFEAMREALKNNQAVLDIADTALTSVSIVVNDLFNFIMDNSGAVVGFFKSIFDDPAKSIKEFGKLVKNNIIERFESFLDTLGFLASAIKKVFKGDFKGAMEEAGKAAKEYVDVLTGVDGSVDKIKKGVEDLTEAVVDYATETIKTADAITKQKKSLKLLELQQVRIREQSDRDAENQRQIRDDDRINIDDRIAANVKLGEILETQQQAEQKTVTDRIAALQLQQQELGFTQERYLEIFALNTELIAIEAQQAGFKSEQQINENSLLREKQDLIDADIAKGKKIIASDKKIAAEKKKAEDKKAHEDIKLANIVKDAKINAASSAFQAATQFAEQGSAASKGLAVAQAIVSTYQGANAIFAAAALNPSSIAFPAQPFIMAGAAIAAGLANVKSILSVKASKTGTASGGGGGSAPSIPNIPSVAAPDFAITGDDGQSQLADSVSGAQSQPVRSYIVSADIKSNAAFDRQTQNGASFG